MSHFMLILRHVTRVTFGVWVIVSSRFNTVPVLSTMCWPLFLGGANEGSPGLSYATTHRLPSYRVVFRSYYPVQ